MSSLYTQQSYNLYKTFTLMSIFLVVVIAVGWGASLYFNSPLILYVVVIFSILLNIASYWKSHDIVIKLTNAKPIKREDYFDYWNIVENLCIRLGVTMPSLYIIEDQSPNAFATGRSPKKSAIVVTRGLLEIMEKTELEGVLAHELAHIQNRDTLLMTSVVVLFGIVTIILDFLLHSIIWGGSREKHPIFIVVIIASYFLIPIILSLIRLAVSRRREYQADTTAALYTRYPEGLASALEKIKNSSSKSMKNANTSTAHLFISDPFLHKSKKIKFMRLFDTHPPIEKRIESLLGKNSK